MQTIDRDTDYRVAPGGSLNGRLRVPGDKSISHRALMLGALADGRTEISNFLTGADCLATLHAFEAMGVPVTRDGDRVSIEGVGLHGLQAPSQTLDLGNSGTSIRLLTGLLCGQSFDTVLTGDASLRRRPMRRITEPLAAMGALIDASPEGCAPLSIRGGQRLRGIDYAMPVASAQVKSSLLLAGLYADGRTLVREPGISRDHSERMLRAFGCSVDSQRGIVSLTGGTRLTATPVQVPGDLSSAAFFLVGAAISPGSDLVLEDVGINPTRAGVIEILDLMGADIDVLDRRQFSGEPVADLHVRGARLQGVHIPERLVALAIDEFPALFVAAACAEGETILSGAAELRVKESDRIQVMADGLRALGADATARADGMVIRGGQLDGGRVASHGDHRVAMAFAMAALRARGVVEIDDCANVSTSFPGFVETARSVGLDISAAQDAPRPA